MKAKNEPLKISNVTSNDFFKSILDTSFQGIMAFRSIRDSKGKIADFEWIFANDIAGKITGQDSKDLIGKRLLEVMPANKEVGLFDEYCQVVETGNDLHTTQHYVEDKVEGWFKIAAVKLEDGFTVSFQDITELKNAAQQSQKEQKKYQKLFDESIDAIFLANDSLELLEVNARLVSLFGYEKKEMLDEELSFLFPDQDTFHAIKQAVDSGQIEEEFEIELHTKAAKKIECLVNFGKVQLEDGNDTLIIGVIRDLTKRKRAEQELVQAEKLSLTGKLARSIGHEVRNPLTNVSLALEQLKDEIASDHEDSEMYFTIISRNVRRINDLITDLLNSSKRKELTLSTVAIDDLINAALQLVQDRIKLLNVTLKTRLESNIPVLQLDFDQMKIALVNLLINAIEAMEADKGVLEIRTSSLPNTVLISVRDNGKGIPKENLPTLFEPFFTGKRGGAGLGLTSAHNIVNSHNGKMHVESSVGLGTTFTISLPR